MPNTN